MSRARWATGVVATALVVWVAVVLWVADRGFDVTDEGFYLLSYRWWDSTPQAFSGIQYLYGPVLQLLDGSVPALRVFRLVTILVAHGVLGWSLVGWCRARFPEQVLSTAGELATAGAVLLSGAVMYGGLPLSPGYNDVTALCSVLLAAALFRVLRAVRLGQRLPAPTAAGTGVVLVLLVVARWSAAAVIGILVLAVAVVIARRGGLRGAVRFVVVLGGAAVATGTLFVWLAGGPDAVSTIVEVNRAAAREGHSPAALLGTYLESVLEIGFLAAALAVVPAICLAGAVRLRRRGSVAVASVVAVAGSALLVGLVWPTRFGLPEGGVLHAPRYAAVLIGLAGFAVLSGLLGSREPGRSADGELVAVLAALPVLQVLGTDNPLYLVVVNGLGCWTAAMVIAVRRTPPGSVLRAGTGSALVVAVAVALLVGLSGLLEHPYRTSPPDRADAAIGGTSPVAGLQVGPASAAWFAAVRTAVGPVPSGAPVVAFDQMAGLVLALDGRSVGEAWYAADDHRRTATGIRSACARGNPWGGVLPVVIFNRAPEEADRAALRTCGADLDRDYLRIEVDQSPAVVVYRPR